MLPDSIRIHSSPEQLLGDALSGKTWSQVAVLADKNTAAHCYSTVRNLLPAHELITVEAGEEHKNLDTCAHVWSEMTRLGMDRHACLIIVGGGVLGDLGGFCAATYKRGIDFILVPTTLLSQVDASVGGKLGIDFNGFKNHIGVFQLPVATLICDRFLTTLPHRELRSGFAEVIKHCLISDEKMWKVIAGKTLEQQDWAALVKHSVSFKASVVEQDPREKGLRKILNFGHTIGHALETYFLGGPGHLYHGEAIAAGMIAEATIAARLGLLAEKDADGIRVYIENIFGKTGSGDPAAVVGLMRQDKKNKGNKILMALPKGIGNAVWDIEVSEEMAIEALKRLGPK